MGLQFRVESTQKSSTDSKPFSVGSNFMETSFDKEKAREVLTRIKEKSEDDYEKNITYISSGTLILSLTFIEKIVSLNRSECLWTLLTCWGLLVMTLLANLISHQLSSYYHEKTICDFDCGDPKLETNVKRRNKVIRGINWGTTFGLFAGILFLIIFCSINAINMAKENKVLDPKNDPNYFEKGRTITIPSTSGRDTSTGGNSSTGNTSTSSNSSGQGSNNGQSTGNTSDSSQ